MGNVSADGKVLWLSGRFDNVVYAIDTSTGEVKTIKVGREPHGLTVSPQPGRYFGRQYRQYALMHVDLKIAHHTSVNGTFRTWM